MFQLESDWLSGRPPICLTTTHNYQNIVLGELWGVERLLSAIDEAVELEDLSGQPDLIMLAIDSMGAKGMIERGYSKNAIARGILRNIRDLLKKRKIFLMYINTKLNPSDKPSRFMEFVIEEWRNAVSMLRAEEVTAISGLTRAGECITATRTRNQ